MGVSFTSDQEPEWKTRRERIDPKLDAAGWLLRKTAGRTPCRLSEYPTTNGPADYALCADGRVLAFVEAKKVSVAPQEVLPQARRYGKGLKDAPHTSGGDHVPFIYSTNGEVIWFRDLRRKENLSRQVSGFHTPDALREMLTRDFDAAIEWFAKNPIEARYIRDYQIGANEAIEQAIADHKRRMLLAMATGTGKTFTLVHEIYRLMKSRAALRVLFLVDRRALAAQAVRAFKSFEAEPGLKFDQIYEVYSQRFQKEDFDPKEKFDPKVLPQKYLTAPGPQHAFVYVSTIQRMSINLFGCQAALTPDDEPEEDAAADKLDIPIHAFDVIIADECHRGYTAQQVSVWRNTLDHFDAVKVGLTATPAAHTTTYFEHLVFRYGYEQAVRDGYLVDYDGVKITSDVRLKGVFLKEGELVEVVDTRTGAQQIDFLEDEREFSPAEVERAVTSPDSNRKILEEIRKYAMEHEKEHGRFPKTLIFAANDLPHASHADQLVHIAREVFDKGDDFVAKITGRVDRPLQRIREFRNRPDPHIVVTVDLLSTGVDIPDLEFIVFLRPVQSRILFEQMMGRGTRKGEKYPDKSHFVVFDCFDGTLLKRFEKTTGITQTDPVPPGCTIQEIIEAIWQNRDRDYNTRCLVKRLQRIEKQMSGDARDLFAAYIPDGDVGRFAKELPRKLKSQFSATMRLLRDPKFQDLLVNYPRPERTPFFVAKDNKDTVTSEELIGDRWKPDEYIAAFEQFVREHRIDVEAIRVLLERPEKWSLEVLNALRGALIKSDPQFTEKRLQKAYEKTTRKAMVDIISMVKHAAKKQSPLLTAEERVDRAFATLKQGRSFSAEQHAWLDRIREHLVQNIAMAADDFDQFPIFSRNGGWRAADKVFGGRLPAMVETINREMVK